LSPEGAQTTRGAIDAVGGVFYTVGIMIAQSERAFLRRVVEATRKRDARRRADRLRMQQLRARDALAEAQRLAHLFSQIDPDLQLVVLFGSLATGEIGERDFDIDLAVRSRRYLALVAAALDGPFKVDVVDLDTAGPSIVEAVSREGRILYAALPRSL
jgi:predicted nucleotidyltransferase